MKDFYDIDKVRSYAELEIAGHELDMELITKLLGLNISYIRKCDDSRNMIRAGVVIIPAWNPGDVSVWKYRTAEEGTYDTEYQIGELMRVFRKKTNELKSIRERYTGCTMRVNVVVCSKQNLMPVCSVSARQIKFLAEIGVGLYYDICHTPKIVIKCRKRPRLLEKKEELYCDDEQ